jgi:hypothetical protein
MTAYRIPRCAATTPTAPFTSAGLPNAVNRAKFQCLLSNGLCAADLASLSRQRAEVCANDDIRIEHRKQRIEVTRPCGSKEGVDHSSLTAKVGVRDRGLAHPSTGAAGELACSRSRASHQGRDLGEGHPKNVV